MHDMGWCCHSSVPCFPFHSDKLVKCWTCASSWSYLTEAGPSLLGGHHRLIDCLAICAALNLVFDASFIESECVFGHALTMSYLGIHIMRHAGSSFECTGKACESLTGSSEPAPGSA